MDTQQPELFVARDRARRFARRIEEALRERRLAYRGDAVGMATLVDTADATLATVIEDIESTRDDVLAGRVRDRERGYMEMPLLVASEGVADRLAAARRLERERGVHGVDDAVARAGVLELLEDALQRLDVFTAAYDEKCPVGPSRTSDLERILAHVVSQQRLTRGAVQDEDAPVHDRRPPSLQSDPAVLEDLLRSAHAAVPATIAPWHVLPSGPGRPLQLTLGAAPPGAVAVPPPERLERAAEVLRFLHPVAIRCVGRAEAPEAGLLSEPAPPPAGSVDAVVLLLADDAAGGLETVLLAAAGPNATLATDAEKAVRALLQAEPLADEGQLPPGRLVPLLGVLRAVDSELQRVVLPAARSPRCRVLAAEMPREKTRKAPVRRDLVAKLVQDNPAFPAQRLDDVVDAAAKGKLAAKHGSAEDAAVLLALFGRAWRYAGVDMRPAIVLAPLDATDIEELVVDLCDLGALRSQLESGRAIPSERVTRLERACLGVLGRLGRVP